MATLDNSSGKYRGSKAPKHVNARAKAAMMAAVDHHRKWVPQSQRYYEKKNAQKARDTTKPSEPLDDTSAVSSSRCSARSGHTGSIPDKLLQFFSSKFQRDVQNSPFAGGAIHVRSLGYSGRWESARAG
jgi:hypothetical protein